MSNSQNRRARARHIKQLLTTEGANVKRATQEFNEGRYRATESLSEYPELRTQARATKESAIDDLPTLIDQLTETVEANGGQVYLAESAADANAYIESVAVNLDAETVVKSKSMTTEELDLNEHLESVGLSVYETDLGEFVVQVADEAPSHLVGPAIHHSSESIAALFNGHFELDEPLDGPTELTAFARDYLGERIKEADLGITGSNFILAESGTLVIVTNEGNARKCAVTPDTHIAVAGIEKIIPSIRELRPFVELLARSATGQHMSRYLTMLTPPVDTPIADFENAPDIPLSAAHEAREFHLVLIDNGRTQMRNDPLLEEVLYCIRCSACLNSCANFQHVGGHAFGGETYTGGIGTGWEAGVESLDSAAGFNDLCTGCTRCVDQCPVKIDIPWVNTAIRSRVNEAADSPTLDFVYDGLLPDTEDTPPPVRSRFVANFEQLARLGSATAPVSNWIMNRGMTRWLLDRMFGIDRRRPLPSFSRQTFREQVLERTVGIERCDVVLFADTYSNYSLIDRGIASFELLDALGLSVTVPAIHSTGREPFSQGMIATARTQAETVADELMPAVEDGKPIIFIEPSDLAMVRRDYARLLPEQPHRSLARQSVGIFEFLHRLDDELVHSNIEVRDDLQSVFYHGHCQERTLGMDASTVDLLESLGLEITTSSVECCGMAGSFGYKSEYYELSRDIGEDLASQVRTAERETVTASGTSCQEQLGHLGVGDVMHPVELLRPRG